MMINRILLHLLIFFLTQLKVGLGSPLLVPRSDLPSSIQLRTRLIVNNPPYAYFDYSTNTYQGLFLGLLEEVKRVALETNNVTLTFELVPVDRTVDYSSILRSMAADCNTTTNPMPVVDCEQYDLAVGDFSPDRYPQNLFTPSLFTTVESHHHDVVAWALHARLEPTIQYAFRTWMYKTGGFVEQSLQQQQGSSGTSDEYMIAKDATVAAEDDDEDVISTELRNSSFAMVVINFVASTICAIWVIVHRKKAKVKVAQIPFLFLILLGCLISTSTIIALEQPDWCMAVPWLYSVGFSITFGTLFAKIRRVYLLFKAAAELKRATVKATHTYMNVCFFVGIDVAILTIWTLVDPLTRQDSSTAADDFGADSSSSHGVCSSEHWVTFMSIIGCYHLGLMAIACYKCWRARHIPGEFSEGNYLSLAIVSNLQVFLIAVPVLILVGHHAETSFFVKSVIIWMNDFVVLILVFGNLISRVHCGKKGQEKEGELIQTAIKSFQEQEKESAEMASEFFQQSERVLRSMSVVNMSLSVSSLNPVLLSAASETYDDEPESQSSDLDDDHFFGNSNKPQTLDEMFEGADSSRTHLGMSDSSHAENTND